MSTKNELLKKQFKIRIYNFVLKLVKFLIKLPNDPVIKEIKSQLTRSGTSIGANYFEAEGASSKKDYLNFFLISLKSANETKFWLGVLINSNLVPKNLIEEIRWLIEENKQLANIFASSVLTMKGKK